MDTFTFFEDPGHGWLRAPLALVRELGISNRISAYSYRDEAYAYLEEDCDAAVLQAALRDRGTELKVEVQRTNGDSFIRRLRSFH